jgi:hypothetical protein
VRDTADKIKKEEEIPFGWHGVVCSRFVPAYNRQLQRAILTLSPFSGIRLVPGTKKQDRREAERRNKTTGFEFLGLDNRRLDDHNDDHNDDHWLGLREGGREQREIRLWLGPPSGAHSFLRLPAAASRIELWSACHDSFFSQPPHDGLNQSALYHANFFICEPRHITATSQAAVTMGPRLDLGGESRHSCDGPDAGGSRHPARGNTDAGPANSNPGKGPLDHDLERGA